MNYHKTIAALFMVCLINFACSDKSPREFHTSGSGLSLDQWASDRSYPLSIISTEAFSIAFEGKKRHIASRISSVQEEPWTPLGPMNTGGRTLCLAIHPNDPETIFLGSASGGLWKTTTAGLQVEGEAGTLGWSKIETGFPVLGVSSITIDQNDPNIMYIGTGEVYNDFQITAPGRVNRFTRGTYGVGILRSLDGGNTWEKSLDWSYSDLRGVQDIEIDPTDSNIIYAATTIGLLKSTNQGSSWSTIHDIPLAVDVEIHPGSNIVIVTHGNLDAFGTIENGIFRSEDAGITFEKISNGLPDDYTGKAKIDICQSDPNVIYASIQDLSTPSTQPTTPLGLYKSEDTGKNWVQINDTNVALFQGWYSHDIKVNPGNANEIIYTGVDVWKSTDGGVSLTKKSDWSKWFFGKVAIGSPEGTPDYVHADVHEIKYHPTDPNTIYFATDGGLFVSKDAGETFEGRNSGYQTTQFFSTFETSQSQSDIAIGGTQDNATYVFDGDIVWSRILGGDGMSAAIHPNDDNIMYGSAQGLILFKSTDRFQSEEINITPPVAQNELTAFSAPFTLDPSNPDIIYAGRQSVYKSQNGGTSWTNVSGGNIDGSNVIRLIKVDPENGNFLYATTASSPFSTTQTPKLFRSTNGGVSWNRLTVGVPNRIISAITFDPYDDRTAYMTVSGFGTDHVYKTSNLGSSWTSISSNLPDVPTNAILVDPYEPNIIYVGNDLGIYVTIDEGENWELLDDGLPEVVLVADISLSISNNTIRAVTHGNGIYETSLLGDPENSPDNMVTSINNDISLETSIYPNPFKNSVNISLYLERLSNLSLQIYSIDGRLIHSHLKNKKLQKGAHSIKLDLEEHDILKRGLYHLKIQTENESKVYKILKN